MHARTRTVDHLVIGGGPAGAMAAIKLAEAGRRVMLAEKEAGPHHKVCGEFLSREAVEYLRGIAIAPADLGAAPIQFVRLSSGSKMAEARLPFQALSLSRRVLDAALLARAVEMGCEVLRGAAVERLTARDEAWRAQINGEEVAAQTVFLANGKHELRGWNRARGKQSDLIGFKLHWRLKPTQTRALGNFIELFLFPGGYGGLSLVEHETANLCLVVRRAKLRRMGGWGAVLTSVREGNWILRERLQGAEALYARPLAISPIPYGYLASHAYGVWRVGDQAAVIPSFTGDGMSIALHSAALAARMYLAGRSADEYTRTLCEQIRKPMRLATRLSQAMVTASGRMLAPAVLSLLPDTMCWIAAATRVPEGALFARDGSATQSGITLFKAAQ